jgi:hypothetical protein
MKNLDNIINQLKEALLKQVDLVSMFFKKESLASAILVNLLIIKKIP